MIVAVVRLYSMFILLMVIILLDPSATAHFIFLGAPPSSFYLCSKFHHHHLPTPSSWLECYVLLPLRCSPPLPILSSTSIIRCFITSRSTAVHTVPSFASPLIDIFFSLQHQMNPIRFTVSNWYLISPANRINWCLKELQTEWGRKWWRQQMCHRCCRPVTASRAVRNGHRLPLHLHSQLNWHRFQVCRWRYTVRTRLVTDRHHLSTCLSRKPSFSNEDRFHLCFILGVFSVAIESVYVWIFKLCI